MLRALTVAERDSHLANRLVSALVYGWNDVPITTQERIFRDATLMFDGNPSSRVVALYTDLPQIARRARQSTLSLSAQTDCT